jgi:hypothetical protein
MNNLDFPGFYSFNQAKVHHGEEIIFSCSACNYVVSSLRQRQFAVLVSIKINLLKVEGKFLPGLA